MRFDQFVVRPGSKVRLSRIDPGYTGKALTHDIALPQIAQHVARMAKLQYLLYGDGRQSLLVVLQALDAGGKDGVVQRLFSGMNPAGVDVFAFQATEQLRARPRLPVARPPARAGQR